MLGPLQEEAKKRMTSGANQYSSPVPAPEQGSSMILANGRAVQQAADIVGVDETNVQVATKMARRDSACEGDQ
jgi:hypothetical protein